MPLKILRFALIAVVAAFALAQLVPVSRQNPPVESEVPVTAEVRSVLVRACFDCHSNQTVWPWYSRIAPASWLLAKDVREGREELNFSTWSSYEAKKQRKLLRESLDEIREGEMPLRVYTVAHPEARLAAGDIAALERWISERVAALDAPP